MAADSKSASSFRTPLNCKIFCSPQFENNLKYFIFLYIIFKFIPFVGSFPSLCEELRTVGAAETEVIYAEEKFTEAEPIRLDEQLKRCKQLTATLFTLKKLVSVFIIHAGYLITNITAKTQLKHLTRHFDSLRVPVLTLQAFSVLGLMKWYRCDCQNEIYDDKNSILSF